jgi:hypothetical protein
MATSSTDITQRSVWLTAGYAAGCGASFGGGSGEEDGIDTRLDQTRWPQAFFAKHGLFSLQDVYDAVR